MDSKIFQENSCDQENVSHEEIGAEDIDILCPVSRNAVVYSSDEENCDVLLPPPLWILDNFDEDEKNKMSEGEPANRDDEYANHESCNDLKNEQEVSSVGSLERFSISNNEEISNDIEDNSQPTSKDQTHASPSKPSWRDHLKQEFSTNLPLAAHELIQTSFRSIVYHARLSYAARGLKFHKNSDLGNASGYFRDSILPPTFSSSAPSLQDENDLPPFSSLPWVDRQLVAEWRTIFKSQMVDDDEYDLARVIVPRPICRPKRAMEICCQVCERKFDKTLSRHHCRLCGGSFCHDHSSHGHRLPHLGYDHNVPERVCDQCKSKLVERDLAERVAWRTARCRDFLQNDLTPYFEPGVDTVEDAAIRIARATIRMAKQIPLGAQATVAVETVDVLRKHGLKGVYGLVLRKEFMAAADLLCKVTGINKRSWPLSVHELSAAIFYALAQHRGLRGHDTEKEEWIHTLINERKQSMEKSDCVNATMTKAQYFSNECEKNKTFNISTLEEKKDESLDSKEQEIHDDILDETDVYNPLDRSYADLLEMADLAIQIEKKSDGNKTSQEHQLNMESDKATIPKQLGADLGPKEDSSSQKKCSDDPSNEKPAYSHRPKYPKNPVCHPVSDSLLSSLLFYAPIALNFIYCTNAVDMQLLAAQQNWNLIYANLEQDATLADRPASALFVHKTQKIACFAVRGTATINDVVTDIRAMPVPFPDNPLNGTFEDDWMPVDRGQGLAVCGMARSAGHLYREHIDCIAMLANQGYRIRITGHSLGGGVATLLGALVRQYFEKKTQSVDSLNHTITNNSNITEESIMDHNDLLRVYTYAVPSCVDAKLADFCKGFVISVVCHDDVIPRLTPTSIRALLKHLLHIRKTWVKAHLGDDITQIADRLKGGWAPRWRGGFTLTQQNQNDGQLRKKARSSTKWVKQKIVQYKKNFNEAKTKVIGGKNLMSNKENEDCSLELKETLKIQGKLDDDSEVGSEVNGENDDPGSYNMYDGDYFYEAAEDENDLLEEDEDETREYNSYHQMYGELYSAHHGVDYKKKSLSSVEEDDWVPFDEPAMEMPPIPDFSSEEENDDESKSQEEETSNSAAPVMLEEMTLPRMFIPGKIVHIYTYNGGYKAACVPRTFRELRRISLAGNMLKDHTCKSYYEALLEVRSIRKANKPLPQWTGFGEDDTCSCCASPFTWASTSNSEAQKARDKHNCRSCGSLVCDPCSKNRIPLPQIGLEVPLRVCDRCYFDLGGVLNADGNNSLTMSFIEEEESSTLTPTKEHSDTAEEVENNDKSSLGGAVSKGNNTTMKKIRSKRSLVVDDLVNRIQSSSIY